MQFIKETSFKGKLITGSFVEDQVKIKPVIELNMKNNELADQPIVLTTDALKQLIDELSVVYDRMNNPLEKARKRSQLRAIPDPFAKEENNKPSFRPYTLKSLAREIEMCHLTTPICILGKKSELLSVNKISYHSELGGLLLEHDASLEKLCVANLLILSSSDEQDAPLLLEAQRPVTKIEITNTYVVLNA